MKEQFNFFAFFKTAIICFMIMSLAATAQTRADGTTEQPPVGTSRGTSSVIRRPAGISTVWVIVMFLIYHETGLGAMREALYGEVKNN